ncbi:MAG: undecaprenyl-diphosphate phosphatase [archaeon]|nr:undecaprenyl-diphosphate phosphatase [archaeon]
MGGYFAALIIAIVQGLTEWLPVSSSGHLVLFERMLDFESSIAFNVALHFGTLLAVISYFWGDLIEIAKDFFSFDFNRKNAKLALLLIIATIPAALIGLIFRDFLEGAFLSLGGVAFGFLITATILFIVSCDFGKARKKGEFGYLESLFVGVAQAVAILPGISRSGATLSAGIFFGLNEKEAVRFSFLMAIPVILGATILEFGVGSSFSPQLVFATLVSFLVGLIAIHFMLKWITRDRKNLRWFALYCLLLAIVLGLYLLF